MIAPAIRRVTIIAFAMGVACSGGVVALSPSPSPTTQSTASSTPAASPSAAVTASSRPSASATPVGTPRETRDARTFAGLSLADRVGLALDDQMPLERPASALARPDGWVLDVNEFAGRVGPFSALDLLARDAATTMSIGPHPQCASPTRPTPAALAAMRRISIQPMGIDTCLKWWAVDLFVSSGRIAVVSLDLWAP
jgi:hypothetical protein